MAGLIVHLSFFVHLLKRIVQWDVLLMGTFDKAWYSPFHSVSRQPKAGPIRFSSTSIPLGR